MSKYIKVYRVVENTNSNDFNNEMPYTIITYELDEKNNKMRVSGYAQWVDAKDFYYYRGLAEQDLVRLCSNQLQQENEQLKKELEESDAYRLKYNLAGAEETIEVLKNQLAEKEQEIKKEKEITIELVARCKTLINEKYDLEYKHIMSRHEICEKIRDKLKKCITPACGTYIVYYEAKNVEDVLDQIERGIKDGNQ